jgi:glycosyltransferase involved in cell wall biosynthesis
MKILFSVSFYSPYLSGLTNFVKRIAEEMASSGNIVTVICFKHQSILPDNEILNRVNVVRIKPWLKLNKGLVSGEWIKKSWSLVKSSDVIVINLPQAEGWITALAAKLMNKKVIAVYICQVNTQIKFINYFLDAANDITLKLAYKVVTLTEDYANNTPALKKYKNKLSFIYPLMVKPKTNRSWEKTARNKLENKKIVIGVAARLATEKGLEYFLETIPLLKTKLNKDFILVIAGLADAVGEQKYKNMIYKLVDKYKENAVILGTVPEEGMGSFYKLLDLLVLPSTNSTEAFGMVQIEAMYYGVPVIASDLPGVRVPVQKTGMGMIVPVKNSQKLAEAIIEVLNNKSRYIKHLKEVKKEFGYKNIKVQWQKLFFD